jgi:hypothetical protein
MSTTALVPGRPGRPNAFRRNLPDRVQDNIAAPLPRFEPEVEAAIARSVLRSPPVNWRRITRQDARDFLLAYCACFIALQTFFLT